jgi:hypothetical protein
MRSRYRWDELHFSVLSVFSVVKDFEVMTYAH